MHSLVNLALLLLVPIPSVAFAVFLNRGCEETQYHMATTVKAAGSAAVLSWTDLVCAKGFQHPFLTANILFFINVCLLFWVISLLQRSTWLIDPYW